MGRVLSSKHLNKNALARKLKELWVTKEEFWISDIEGTERFQCHHKLSEIWVLFPLLFFSLMNYQYKKR